MAPSIAAGRAGKARMSEHRDVRVRAGARPVRSAGQSSQPDVGEIVMPARWFWRLLPKQKSPARGSERNLKQSCDAGARVSLSHPTTCVVGHPPPQAEEGINQCDFA